MDVIGFLLPNPKKFIEAALESCATNGKNGQLFLEVITIDHTEKFPRVGGGAVFPVGADGIGFVGEAMIQNVGHVLDEDFICFAHNGNNYRGRRGNHIIIPVDFALFRFIKSGCANISL